MDCGHSEARREEGEVMSTAVGAVYDRPFNCKLTIFGGHRPPLQRGKQLLVWVLLVGALVFAPPAVLAQQETEKAQPQTQTEAPKTQPEEKQPQKEEDGKLISVPGGKALGMSILGNQEAPKALV